ncbi:polysaccharide biosynthesis tyrosine autokinase [Flavobacterium sp. CS20]|uniref:polysaccharide biosynthesis tyrosine autokinase n=1 Tax=Flavobacterium sp. CS20 TaxID=2775246 RepID=UPI001B3A5E7D|nr:tyrosine-protein kinase family protein [Flavobacterium sp. CS20]QTY27697.1 polysaccharide biosynthesis tyrosine autokinase [Flavobacterium sp. CS20]
MQELDFSNANSYFDFKAFLFKMLAKWYWFVFSIAIGLGIAYYISVRKLPIYKMSSIIALKDEQNSLFANSNTSLTFNWGGQSNKMSSTVMTLQTRTHNEKVVRHLQYYLQYLEQGKYQKVDAYGRTPFQIDVQQDAFQLKGKLMKVQLLDDKQFVISFDIEEEPQYLSYYNYAKESSKQEKYQPGQYIDTFDIDKPIASKFFTGKLTRIDGDNTESKVYYIQFLDFNSVVKNYRDIVVESSENGGSIINLSLTGNNKDKLVKYLNTTSKILSDDLLAQKNLFATKTISFIDSTLSEKASELDVFEKELNAYKLDNKIIDLDAKTERLKDKLISLDMEKEAMEEQINYLDRLKSYLQNRSTYENPPAPSVVGINEESIVEGVQKMVELSLQRSKFQYLAKSNLPKFKDIDRQIDATKKILFETIDSFKDNMSQQIKDIEQQLKQAEKEVSVFPKEQQGLLKIERRYDLTQQSYNLFLSKLNEAKLIKASNVSDIHIIDEAKDVGGHKIGPNNQLNYVMAIFFGAGVPLAVIFVLVLLDNKINTPSDITKLVKTPLIGVIGKSKLETNKAVFAQPNSVISESFRDIRTSLQFVFKNKSIEGAKTILITSSISGEGKTFTGLNLASIMALSEKKTILVGLDLRKPKIHKDFDVDREKGVSNYISNQLEYKDIIQKSNYEYLDILTSGTIPPNPSELIIDNRMDELMNRLKSEYDFIILDSPPIGLVSDAINLVKYADTTIYVVRQNYTKKGMLSLLKENTKKGKLKNVNVVLNYFKVKSKYGYYNYGYGYGFGYGYGTYGRSYLNKEKRNKSLKRRIKHKLKNWFS